MTQTSTIVRKSQPILHRVNITSPSKLINPTITAVPNDTQAGSLAASATVVMVMARNRHGTAGVGTAIAVTPTLNKSFDLTIPQVTGATHYGIFVGITTAQWLVTITEAQRAAGCAISAQNTIITGGSAGVINVRVLGTGALTTAQIYQYNNAYMPETITPVPCTGYRKALVNIDIDVPDLNQAPTCAAIPFFLCNGKYYAAGADMLKLLTEVGNPLNQTLEIDVNGRQGLVVILNPNYGTASATVELVS